MDKLKQLLAGLFLGANGTTLLFLWVCCASTWANPSVFPLLSVATLAFPIFLLANVAFVVFWLVFKPRYALVPLLGIAAVGSFVLDYCPLKWKREVPDGCLLLMSYNTGNAYTGENTGVLLDYLRQTNADIVCLQEIAATTLQQPQAKALLDSLRYQLLQKDGRIVLSRLPIISDTVPLPIGLSRTGNGTLACLVEYEGDTLMIVNNHLESNGITLDEKTEYKDMLRDPNTSKVKSSSRMLVGKLARAAKVRGAQVDSLCHFLDAHRERSMLVCGDFNDTPVSYTHRMLSRHLVSSFRESGFGIGLSYNQIGFFVRIDHVFHSADWESHSTHIDTEISLSDHYPMLTFLHKKLK